MEWKYTEEKTVNRFQVYGTDYVYAPDGYEFTGEFRPPINGDLYIPPSYQRGFEAEAATACEDFPSRQPRLILRKKAKRRVLVGEWELTPSCSCDIEPGYVTPKLAENLADKHSWYRIEERD